LDRDAGDDDDGSSGSGDSDSLAETQLPPLLAGRSKPKKSARSATTIASSALAAATSDPNALMQLKMLELVDKIDRRQSKRGSGDSDSDSDSDGLPKGGAKSSLRGLHRLRRRVRQQPMRILKRYRKKSMAKLGVRVAPDGRLTAPFMHILTSERLREAFGRMTGMWRVHYSISYALDLLDGKRSTEAAATLVQLQKALHQTAIDDGSWHIAAHFLPFEDPLGREVFGGDEDEMEVAAAWNRGMRDLQTRVAATLPTPRARAAGTTATETPVTKQQKKALALKKAAEAAPPGAPTK